MPKKKPSKIMWVCVADHGEESHAFARKSDVCSGYFFGRHDCCAYAEGCRPVKYVRADGKDE